MNSFNFKLCTNMETKIYLINIHSSVQTAEVDPNPGKKVRGKKVHGKKVRQENYYTEKKSGLIYCFIKNI